MFTILLLLESAEIESVGITAWAFEAKDKRTKETRTKRDSFLKIFIFIILD